MTGHSMIVCWTYKNGDTSKLTVGPYPTARQAWDKAIHDAKAFGWTPPKWWQWWRSSDYPRTDKFE